MERSRENPNDVSKKITSDYRIEDNFLEVNDFQNLINLLLGKQFDWYHNHDDKEDDLIYFNHFFYNNYGFVSKYSNQIKPFMKKLMANGFVQIRASLFNRTIGGIKEFTPDYTFEFDHKVLLYFINANDGYTTINGNKIYSRDNRGVWCNTNQPFTHTSCTNDVFRGVIEFHYF